MNLFSGLEKFGIKATDSTDLYADEKAAEKKTKEKVETAVVQPKEEDFLLDKTVRCPVCDKEFKTRMVKAGKVKRLEPDADLRPRQQYVDSLKYDVASCPNCGYTSLNRYFEHITMGQIKLIKEQISRNFHPQAPSDDATWDYDKAIEMHKLSLFNSMVKKARTSEKAYNCLILAWLLRTKAEELETAGKKEEAAACRQEEESFYKEAYDGMMKAVSTEMFPICGMDQSTMDYLLANMAFHYKQYDVTSKCLSRVLSSASANRKIKDKSLELKEIILKELKKNR